MNPWILSVALAYLLGSIPFGYILVKVFRKQDIRASGSGNIGATNVLRSGAKGLGIATLLLDLGKAVAAVLLAEYLARGRADAYSIAAAAGLSVVVGHVFPIWLGFRGGKGVASALGAFLALTPASALAVLGIFLLVFLLSRYVSLASIVAAALFPAFALYFVPVRTPVVIACFVLIPLIIIAKHRGNISRLISGTEGRFASRKAAS